MRRGWPCGRRVLAAIILACDDLGEIVPQVLWRALEEDRLSGEVQVAQEALDSAFPLVVFADILADAVTDRGLFSVDAAIHTCLVGKAVPVIRADFLMGS